jgi:hypothetical protein
MLSFDSKQLGHLKMRSFEQQMLLVLVRTSFGVLAWRRTFCTVHAVHT